MASSSKVTAKKAKKQAAKARASVAAPAAKPTVCLPCLRARGAAPISSSPRNPRPPCCVTGMTIKRPKGKAVASLPTKPGTAPPVIKLIADTKTGSSTVTISLAGGPCQDGFNDRPIIEAFDGTSLVAAAAGTLEFEAPGPRLSDLTWKSVLFPTSLVHRSQIQALLCDGANAYVAEVLVYPKVTYDITISLPGFTVCPARGADKHGDLKLGAAEGERTWGGSFEVVVAGNEFPLGDEFEQGLDSLCGFVALGERFFRVVDEVVATASGGKQPIEVEISGLKVEAKANFSNDEMRDGLGIDHKLELSVRFEPLVRVAVRLDILESVILAMSANGVGRVIEWAYRKSLSDPSNPPLALFLEIAGQIGGGFAWKKTFGSDRWNTEKDFKGALEAKLWGEAKGAIRCWGVSAGASVKVSAETGLWVKIFTESEAPAGEISAQVGHDGVTFTGAVAVTYSGKVSSDAPEGTEDDAPSYEQECSYEWIAPVTKPSEDDAYHFSFWREPA